MPTKPAEPEFIKVNKWDGTAVKNSLDDAVKDILTKKLNYVAKHVSLPFSANYKQFVSYLRVISKYKLNGVAP